MDVYITKRKTAHDEESKRKKDTHSNKDRDRDSSRQKHLRPSSDLVSQPTP